MRLISWSSILTKKTLTTSTPITSLPESSNGRGITLSLEVSLSSLSDPDFAPYFTSSQRSLCFALDFLISSPLSPLLRVPVSNPVYEKYYEVQNPEFVVPPYSAPREAYFSVLFGVFALGGAALTLTACCLWRAKQAAQKERQHRGARRRDAPNETRTGLGKVGVEEGSVYK